MVPKGRTQEFVFVLGPLEIDIRSRGQRDCAWLGGWNLQVPEALNRSNGASSGTLCPRKHWLTFQRYLANTLGGQILLIRLRNRWVDSGRKEGGKGESTGEEAITSREEDSRATHLLILIQFVHSAHPLLPIFTFSRSPVPEQGEECQSMGRWSGGGFRFYGGA